MFAVATAEFRSLRRSVATWVVVALALTAGLAPFLYYSAAHGIRSGYSCTAGSVAPRFLVHGFGGLLLLALMAGMILLALDVLARDRRDGIADTVAARPVSNLALLAGRAAALALAAWLAPALLALATLALGGAAQAVGYWTGDFVEPLSLAAFVFLDAPATLATWAALVVFLPVVLRSALAAATVAFALLALHVWALLALPAWQLPVLSLLPRFAEIASDVLPEFVDLGMVAQRLGLLLLASGAVCLAATAFARRDDDLPACVAAGVAFASLGAAVVALLLMQAMHERAERAGWIADHQERQGTAELDIERVEVRLAIDPGRQLHVDATLRVRAETPRNALLFHLNPGLEIDHVRSAGAPLEHRHEQGLLDVRLTRPLAAGDAIELSVRASGVPDPRFAYLDEALDPSVPALGDSLLRVLGTEASIFDDQYVALLPGVAWLPAAGSAFETEPDFFDLALDVDVPSGWLAAGPGRRKEAPTPDGGMRFGFRPSAPVAGAAVLASSRFERRAARVGGVEVELLFHRRHMRNIEFFRDAADWLRDHIQAYVEWCADCGWPYPYGSLSFVEAPAPLRAFGGGRRMDSVLAAPGIVMVREHGFPTARFDFVSQTSRYEFIRESARQRGDANFAGRALELILGDYLTSEHGAGDPYAGLARNLLRFRTWAQGPDASRLDLTVEMLANRLTGHSKTPFSARTFVDAPPHGFGARLLGRTMADTAPVQNALVDRQVDAALRPLGSILPVGALAPGSDAVEYGRAAALAELVVFGLGVGRDRLSLLLAGLLRRAGDRTFAPEELLAAVQRQDARLAEILTEQIQLKALPGFVHSPLEVVRIADDARGQPRYLSRLHVRNDERVPGVVSLVLYVMGNAMEGMAMPHPSDLIRVAGGDAVEIEVATSAPPVIAQLVTFLSRNRGVVALETPGRGGIPQTDDRPAGVRPSRWRPPPLDGLVIDDLDAGFAVRKVGGPAHGIRALATGADATAEGSRPLADVRWNGPKGRWGRQPAEGGWGKYRATVVAAASGDGDEEAVFAAELPATGRWRLHYHLPSDRYLALRVGERRRWQGLRESMVGDPGFRISTAGTYRMRLTAGAEAFDIAFDAGQAGYGWHLLGEYDLKSRNVSLAVSSRGDAGAVVIADAVWWQRHRAATATGL